MEFNWFSYLKHPVEFSGFLYFKRPAGLIGKEWLCRIYTGDFCKTIGIEKLGMTNKELKNKFKKYTIEVELHPTLTMDGKKFHLIQDVYCSKGKYVEDYLKEFVPVVINEIGISRLCFD
jgi:hypothetical protein